VKRINLLRKAKNLLRMYGVSPKKRLGQHFTVDIDLLQRLVTCSSINKDDVVLEVGAGLGFLTQLLSCECKKVIAVEVDPILVKILKYQLNKLQNVDLIQGDILSISLPAFTKVVSAPPYSISSPLLFRLLECKFDWAVLILQKELAERLAASVGTKDYGRLTVNIYYKANVELLDSVPRKMFYPSPDVDSMMLRLKPREAPFPVKDKETFFELVQVLFTQRNKKVRNALIPFLLKRKMNKKEAVELADSTIYRAKRVRELAPEEFGILTNELLRMLTPELTFL
jgi:16S rRNA (adenine1518-N6/adenine1519-N6)-dimethyltransferase